MRLTSLGLERGAPIGWPAMPGAVLPSLALVASMLAAGEAPPVRLGPADNGRRVTLAVGACVALTLRQNPTTGYSWSVASSGEPVMHQEGDASFVPDGRQRGGGGTVTCRFRAAKAGRAEVTLVYSRPWEKNTTPAGTFRFTVEVAP
jgi:inhibitor of cysteine peptidase